MTGLFSDTRINAIKCYNRYFVQRPGFVKGSWPCIQCNAESERRKKTKQVQLAARKQINMLSENAPEKMAFVRAKVK